MEPISINEVRDIHRESDSTYLEFLREESLSMGLYSIPAGQSDPQTPHSEDEVYFITAGQAKIRIADEEYSVEKGDIIFVKKHVEHEFFEIEEALETLVFFAPAEGTLVKDG